MATALYSPNGDIPIDSQDDEGKRDNQGVINNVIAHPNERSWIKTFYQLHQMPLKSWPCCASASSYCSSLQDAAQWVSITNNNGVERQSNPVFTMTISRLLPMLSLILSPQPHQTTFPLSLSCSRHRQFHFAPFVFLLLFLSLSSRLQHSSFLRKPFTSARVQRRHFQFVTFFSIFTSKRPAVACPFASSRCTNRYPSCRRSSLMHAQAARLSFA